VNSTLLITTTAQDEDNVNFFDGTINDMEGWGEDGITTKLINITTTTYEFATTKVNVDGQEHLLRYYVEEPTNLGDLEDIKTKGNLDYTFDLFEPTHATKEELLHSKKLELHFAFTICCPFHIYLQGK